MNFTIILSKIVKNTVKLQVAEPLNDNRDINLIRW